MLVYAVITITLALIFYTVGIWGEKIQGQLKVWHLVVLWLGLIFDATGTVLMSTISGGGFALNGHSISGALAIVLMLFSVIWATIVLVKNNKKMKEHFHRFSIAVWIIWLIPYISGLIIGMNL